MTTTSAPKQHAQRTNPFVQAGLRFPKYAVKASVTLVDALFHTYHRYRHYHHLTARGRAKEQAMRRALSL